MSFDEIVVATKNRKKGEEILKLLEGQNIRVLTVSDFEHVPDVVEDAETFAGNAARKATEIALALKYWVIGEDSGLCVDALKGAPGIYSARYAGEHGDDHANNEKLIHELQGVPRAKRTAHYVCSIALSNPQGQVVCAVERTCSGLITEAPRGDYGFGYDPYFEVQEFHQTFGELNPIVKKYLSHRARAFQEFIPQLLRLHAKSS
jgi:XTP/dITP diphosphohydrolase